MKIKKRSKKASVYKKYLYAFITYISVFTLLISFSLYFQYSNTVFNILKKQNQKVLSQIRYSKNYMDTVADYLTKTLFLNNSVRSCLYTDPYDSITRTSALSSISSLHIADYINSIYLYNGKYDSYIESRTGSIKNSDKFYDTEINSWIKSYENTEDSITMRNYPRQIQFNNNTENVYTYAFIEWNGQSIESAIIVNFNIDWLTEQINYLDKDNSSSEILVIDKKGKVVSDISNNLFQDDISNRSYIKRIIESTQESETFTDMINDNKFLLSYVSSNEDDWIFISITPYKTVFENMIKLRNFTIIIFFVLLLIGWLVSWLMSRNFYKPIFNLTKIIPISYESKLPKSKNELEIVSAVMKIIIDNNQKLMIEHKDNESIVKNNKFRRLLSGESSSNMDLQDININLDEPMLMIAIDIISRAKSIEDSSQYDRKLNKFIITNIAHELFSDISNLEIINDNDNRIIIIINSNNKYSQKEIIELCENKINTISDFLKKHFDIIIFATRGYFIENSNYIPTLYKDIINLSKYRLIYSDKNIISPKILTDTHNGYYNIDENTLKLIIRRIKSGDLPQTIIEYNKIVSEVLNYKYDNIVVALTYLSFSLYNEFNNIIDEDETIMSLIMKLLKIEQFDTFDEINYSFKNLFRLIIRLLNNISNNHKFDVVKETINIIGKNYADTNLCLNGLAHCFSMSPVYLGRLFKERKKQSIANYIMNFRMEKVGEYLRNSDFDINEILEKVGLEKSNYFYTTFKKYFGVSLTSYKRKI